MMSTEDACFIDSSTSEIGEDLRWAIEQLQAVPSLNWNGTARPSLQNNDFSSASTNLYSTSGGSCESDTVFYADSVIAENAIKTSEIASRFILQSTPSPIHNDRLSDDLSFSSRFSDSVSQCTPSTDNCNQSTPGTGLSLRDADIVSITNSLDRAIKDNFPFQEVKSDTRPNLECSKIYRSSETFAAPIKNKEINLDFKIRKVRKHALPNIVNCSAVTEESSDRGGRMLHQDVPQVAMNSVNGNHGSAVKRCYVRCESPDSLVERILEEIGSNDSTADDSKYFSTEYDHCISTVKQSTTQINENVKFRPQNGFNKPLKPSKNVNLEIASKSKEFETTLKQNELNVPEKKSFCDTPVSFHIKRHKMNNLKRNVKYTSPIINDNVNPFPSEPSVGTLSSEPDVKQRSNPTHIASTRASRFDNEKSPEEIFEEIVESLRNDDDCNESSFFTESDPSPCLSSSNHPPMNKVLEEYHKAVHQQEHQYECEVRDYTVENEQLEFYYSQARIEKIPVMQQSINFALEDQKINKNDTKKFDSAQSIDALTEGLPSITLFKDADGNVELSNKIQDSNEDVDFSDCFSGRKNHLTNIKSSEHEVLNHSRSSCTHNGPCELIYSTESECISVDVISNRLMELSQPMDPNESQHLRQPSHSSDFNNYSEATESITEETSSTQHCNNEHADINVLKTQSKPESSIDGKKSYYVPVSNVSSENYCTTESSTVRTYENFREIKLSKRQTTSKPLISPKPKIINQHKGPASQESAKEHEKSSSNKMSDKPKSSKEHSDDQNSDVHSHIHNNSHKSAITNTIKNSTDPARVKRIKTEASNDGLNLNIDNEFLRNVEACTNSDIDGGSLENLLSQNDDAFWQHTISRLTPNQLRKRFTRTTRIYQESDDNRTDEQMSRHSEGVTLRDTQVTSVMDVNNKDTQHIIPVSTVEITKIFSIDNEESKLIEDASNSNRRNEITITSIVNPNDNMVSQKVTNLGENTTLTKHLGNELHSNNKDTFAENLELLLEDLNEQKVIFNSNSSTSVEVNQGRWRNADSVNNITIGNAKHSSSSLESSSINATVVCDYLDDLIEDTQQTKYDLKENANQDVLESSIVTQCTLEQPKVNYVAEENLLHDMLNLQSSKVKSTDAHNRSLENVISSDENEVGECSSSTDTSQSSDVNASAMINTAPADTLIVKINDTDENRLTEKSSIIPGMQILSEEVIVQEIVLNISWPGGSKYPNSRPRRTRKLSKKDVAVIPQKPFRELQLQRLIKMSGWDLGEMELERTEPTDKDSKECIGEDPKELISQSSFDRSLSTCADRTLSIEDKYICRNMSADQGKSRVSELSDSNQIIDAENNTKLIVKATKESLNDYNEAIDVTSVMNVQREECVRVIRVPADAIYRVPSLKHVVEAVSQTVLDDAQLLPESSNIRVVCDATECRTKPKAVRVQDERENHEKTESLGDSNVIVIRREIFDKNSVPTSPTTLAPSCETLLYDSKCTDDFV